MTVTAFSMGMYSAPFASAGAFKTGLEVDRSYELPTGFNLVASPHKRDALADSVAVVAALRLSMPRHTATAFINAVTVESARVDSASIDSASIGSAVADSTPSMPICFATPTGFEPATSTVTGWRALQTAPRGHLEPKPT